MSSCLLVIDVQQSFTRRPYFSPEGVAAFLTAQNALIDDARHRGLPIVRVLHVEPGDDAGNPFCEASGLVRPLEGLSDFDPALTVRKQRHSALVGTGLDVWLVAQGIRTLVITGIRTEQCCETTARHASDLGWRVRFVPEATLTFDMPLHGGGLLRSDAIRQRTAAVLHKRFAEVVPVQQAFGDA